MKIAIVGATGAVGTTVLRYLEARKVPAEALYLIASQRSAGQFLPYRGQALSVSAIDQFDFSQTQLAFFAAGSSVAKQYAPQAVAMGNWVIDKSSRFRMDEDVPLIVPGVNCHQLNRNQPGIIAVPNCSTIPLNMVLKPIRELYGLKRVEIATYQAVSGAGKAGMADLEQQLQAHGHGEIPVAQHFHYPILHNVLACIDAVTPSGYTLEELKLQQETRKILELPDLIVNATAVRVPVVWGHCEAVSIETERAVDLAELINVLQHTPQVRYVSMPAYPNPLEHAMDEGAVWVGRVRRLPEDQPWRVSLWLLSNNVGRGAALTAIDIAERLGLLMLST